MRRIMVTERVKDTDRGWIHPQDSTVFKYDLHMLEIQRVGLRFWVENGPRKRLPP